MHDVAGLSAERDRLGEFISLVAARTADHHNKVRNTTKLKDCTARGRFIQIQTGISACSAAHPLVILLRSRQPTEADQQQTADQKPGRNQIGENPNVRDRGARQSGQSVK